MKATQEKSFKKPAVIAGIGFFAYIVGNAMWESGPKIIGVLLMLWAAWLAFRVLVPKADGSGKVGADVRDAIEPLQYKSMFNSTAIGIDPERKLLHLFQNKNYKVYSFADIRSWSANIQTGGQMIGGGGNLGNALAMTAANVRNQRDNAENTGFFIEVRDIDFPKWKIDFPADVKANHARWMEIFRQYVNES